MAGPTPAAPGRIFLSYRREETEHLAGRLADRLVERFGESQVFMDVDSIPPGVDFAEAIQRAVSGCDVLLALIGRQWTTLVDEQGRRRIDDPDDFIVLEVRAALDRNIPVIPVLVDGAVMPQRRELPKGLEQLSRRNAARLDAVSFRLNIGWLLEHLEKMLSASEDATALASTGPPQQQFTSSSTIPSSVDAGPEENRASVIKPEAARPGAAEKLPQPDQQMSDTGSAADVGSHPSDWRLRGAPVDRRTVLRLAGSAAAALVTGAGVWGASRLVDSDSDSAGRPHWVFETGGEVYSSPEVADGVVYIGSVDHNLYAIDAVTGKERWRYRTGGAVTSSPAIANGLVYFGCNDSRVHAVTAATGTARWTFDTGAVLHSSPAVVQGIVYIGSRDHNLYAIDAVTGKERWRFSGKDWFNSSPTVVNGKVYIGCRDKNVYALDASTGKQRWRYTTSSTVDSSAAVLGDTVWIGSDDHSVYALNAETGTWVWQFTAENGVVSTPRIVGDILYVGSDDSNLYALDATTGRMRWHHATGNGIRSSPIVADGLVYIGSRDRNVYALDKMTGEQRWSFATQGPVDDSSPVVTGGLVYIGSLDHRVYALDAARGIGRR
jgi:outer membrane protein assembly factor BamB